ncbi:TolC family protein [Parabacteroides pacaensis]|uniref:TolC family protein n=1 Tax=Parabacteroides pacaensis TaxID=2086575 RepID=UPI000D101260|nr:TolC family protein [Parabacteroides pacaensis]
MKRYFILLTLGLVFSSGLVKAQEPQEKWDLNTCINYALEHNIQVKKSKVALLESQESTKEAKAQLFPSLSASVTQGFVNYLSTGAISNNSYSGNYSVTANLKLFDGGQRVQSIKQQELQDNVQEFGIQQNENDIEIALTQNYLQILYAYEAVKINENTLQVSDEQRKRGLELYKAGAIAQSDYAQLEAQYSSDKYQLVVAQTNLANYKLALKQLLELDITQDIDVVIPQLNESDILVPLPDKESVYRTSLAVMPEIKSSELNISIAELQTKKAKGTYWPTISLNAGIGTGHLSGTDYSYGSQMWDKFNESIGLTVSVPIFTNRANKTALNQAKLQVITSQLEHLNAQKELLKTVEGIYLDATSAQTQFLSASEKLKSVEESYKLINEQFSLGMKNTLELLTEKNNLLIAQQEVLQSKYMAVLNVQLLNFYQDKPIVLKY